MHTYSASLHGSVVRPLASYLVGLVRPMMASADRVSTAFKILDVAQLDDDIGMMSVSLSSFFFFLSLGILLFDYVNISQALQALDDQYFLLRKRLLFQKSLGQLHPQLRQFYSFLYPYELLSSPPPRPPSLLLLPSFPPRRRT